MDSSTFDSNDLSMSFLSWMEIEICISLFQACKLMEFRASFKRDSEPQNKALSSYAAWTFITAVSKVLYWRIDWFVVNSSYIGLFACNRVNKTFNLSSSITTMETHRKIASVSDSGITKIGFRWIWCISGGNLAWNSKALYNVFF